MKVGAIIQARMGSQRFPGKVLKEIKGKPLLLYLVERLQRCSSLDEFVIATSDDQSDGPVVEFCGANGIPCFRGSLKNVAKRFRDLIDLFPVDAFVRISGDSPLLDQGLLTQAVDVYCRSSYDIVTNTQKRTFPKGQSIEIINSNIYRAHYPLFVDAYDREHVTPYFYRNKEKINMLNLESGKDWGSLQLSIDTQKDFRVVEQMIHLMDKPHWEYELEVLVSLQERVLRAEEVADGNA